MSETDCTSNGPTQGNTIQPLASKARYADDLTQAGLVADAYVATDTFSSYHAHSTANSRAAQRDTLLLFSRYLAQAGVSRSVDDLDDDAEAWRGMSKGILLGFRKWLLEQGYAIGTVNQRLSIVRQYCRLSHAVGVIPDEMYDQLMTVSGYSHKTGRNLDAERTSRGKATRKSTKKVMPTPVSKAAAQQLKQQTTQPGRRRRSEQDQALELRDHLLMGLFIEHALRTSEIVGLNIEDFDLSAGTITVYRQKTDETQIQQMKTHTRFSAEQYLAAIGKQGRLSGPLFVGYQGKRITRFGLYHRVRILGELQNIDHLSPHDLRHYWTYDALGNGTPLDRVQSGGNWKSPVMVLKYAKRRGIANEGVVITE